jgi:hypothetical protein
MQEVECIYRLLANRMMIEKEDGGQMTDCHSVLIHG